MMCRGHVINKMANTYKKTFPVRSKRRAYLSAVSDLLLLFNSDIEV